MVEARNVAIVLILIVAAALIAMMLYSGPSGVHLAPAPPSGASEETQQVEAVVVSTSVVPSAYAELQAGTISYVSAQISIDVCRKNITMHEFRHGCKIKEGPKCARLMGANVTFTLTVEVYRDGQLIVSRTISFTKGEAFTMEMYINGTMIPKGTTVTVKATLHIHVETPSGRIIDRTITRTVTRTV